MRKLCLVLVLVAGCDRLSPAAQELIRKLKELNSVADSIDRELRPLQERFMTARERQDEAEMRKLQQEAQPITQRLRPQLMKREELVKDILWKADAHLERHPDDASVLDVRMQIAEAYELPSKQEEAEQIAVLRRLAADADRLAKLRPKDPPVLLRHASALRKTNRYAEARASLALVLQAEPANARAIAEDGLISYALDDYDACVRRLESADKAALPYFVWREVVTTLSAARERRDPWAKEEALRRQDANADLPQAKLTTSKGEIVVELFEDVAPNLTANFISLAEEKFYDGTRFHRVVPDRMIQGGDPNSRDDDPTNDGQGGPGYTVKDELEEGKFRRHFRGSLSMANSGPDTNGSQFFITHRPTDHLDGRHTVFGRVLSGMDVVDRLAAGDELRQVVVLRKRDHLYKPLIER